MPRLNPAKRSLASKTASGTLELEDIDGVLVPKGGRKDIKDLQDRFRLRADDLFVSSYPKTGTTWVLYIVKLIQNYGVDDGSKIMESFPMLEYMASEELEAMPSPRCLKSHLPYHLLPGGEPATTRAKYIYTYRNPKDTVVSLYHIASGFKYLAESMQTQVPWEYFFEGFLNGKLAYGHFLDHILGWWKHKDAKNVLIVNYESLKNDLPRVVKTMADFLGYRLSPEIITKVAEQSTFEAMKKNPAANRAETEAYRTEGSTPVMRSGVVGDWKTLFTVEQSERMDEECAKKLAGTGITFNYGNKSGAFPRSKL